MTGTQIFTITVPENEWMTSNQRDHRNVKNQKVRLLRTRAQKLAEKYIDEGSLQPVTANVFITAECHYRSGRGLDDDNCQPSVKAIKDGLTLAGFWPDDAGKYINGGTHYLPSRKNPELQVGWHAIRLVIIDQDIPW